MSAQVGTLQPRARMGHLMWPAVVIGLVVALTIAVLATTLGSDSNRSARESAKVGTAANTPSEINAATPISEFPGRALVNTPSELNAAGIGTGSSTVAEGVAVNTPSELNSISSGNEDKDPFAGRHTGPIGFHPLP